MWVLITGGAGFIGSHLAEELLGRGDEVFIIDNLSTGRLDNLSRLRDNARLHFTADNIRNEAVMEELMARCQQVYHLAAAVGVKLIMERPVETIKTNVMGTEVVLSLANKFRRKVLIASSSEVYGKHNLHSLREDDNRVMGSVKRHRWAYANTKTLDEFLALAYAKEKGLPVVVVRVFNTVGPRQTGQYGMVVPNFVQRALAGEAILVYGDGNQTRCFAYVGDVVRGMVGLMNNPAAEGDIFNIGNDQEISILALAQKVKELTGSSSPIKHISYEEAYGEGFEDMERRVPNLDKISSTIGYRPEVDLDETLRRIIEYFRG